MQQINIISNYIFLKKFYTVGRAKKGRESRQSFLPSGYNIKEKIKKEKDYSKY